MKLKYIHCLKHKHVGKLVEGHVENIQNVPEGCFSCCDRKFMASTDFDSEHLALYSEMGWENIYVLIVEQFGMRENYKMEQAVRDFFEHALINQYGGDTLFDIAVAYFHSVKGLWK